MKLGVYRRFLIMHTWLGVVAGALLFIAFYSGAITVFSHEIGDWNRQGAAAAVPADPIARSQQLLDKLLEEHPKAAESVYLMLPGEHGPQPSAYWFEADSGETHRFVFGQQDNLKENRFGDTFIEFIYDLHFTAGLPKPYSTYFFGLICLLYGLALISGVIIYAPTLAKTLFALRIKKHTKVLWQDVHAALGLPLLPFHIIMAWSGAVLALGLLLFMPFQQTVYDGKLMRLVERDFYGAPLVNARGNQQPTQPIRELLQRGQAALPGLDTEGLWLMNINDANARVTLFGDMQQRRLNQLGSVTLEGATGKLVAAVAPTTMTPGMVMLRGLQALHFGNFGHYTVKWLYFILGLAGAFLFYSGNLLWIAARRKHTQVEQPRRTRVMATLTLGICLGCIAGVSAVFIAGALAPDAMAAPVYFTTFLICLLWACVRQPARAGHELLWLCAVITALIPLAGWFNSGDNLFTAAWAGHWHRFFVDATALLLAFGYWRMAKATLHRGRHGDPHSIWALKAPQ